MNAYTTIEESKQLIEAGLDINTADMYTYKNIYTGALSCFNNRTLIGNYNSLENKVVAHPCWSLAALLDIINSNNIPYILGNNHDNESEYTVSIKVINQEGKRQIFDFDKIIGCITWLLEHNYIKSNKNE